MSFFRNREIRRELLLYAVLSAAAAAAGFLQGPAFGIAAVCLCAVFAIVHFTSSYDRYKRIAALTDMIDRLLHGQEKLDLHDYDEGELAVLQNEIYKLTVRMREQADALIRDKAYLADSLADISHQIRTPLTSINLIVSFLSRPELEYGKRAELVKELTGLLSRIDWLISTLLKISKLDAGTAKFKSEPVSVLQLVKKASEPLAVPMDLHGLRFNADIGRGASFLGDIYWTSEAVGNIIKNCAENTPEGGVIDVTAEENALYTEIVIEDSGRGIDAADLPHIFERFYKGKNSSEQSAGIGLALARMIIAEQNGTVKAENKKEGGARFTVRFYKSTV
jgi:signal transduction histidine kinase